MNPLLEVDDLAVHFPITSGVVFRRTVGHVRAVDGVSLSVRRGETYGLVGESGCGKSTLGRAVLRLTDVTRGTVRFDGDDVAGLAGEPLRRMRRRFQMVFQDPLSSLDPRQSVGSLLTEGIRAHGLSRGAEADRARLTELMDAVGLPASALRRYPHEFSGGQRQRIGIARALCVEPDLIVADEPVSALDVSVQAQVLNLLRSLQRRLGLTLLFVSHDLAAVRHLSDRIAVMYLGRVVEVADARTLAADPQHPYTQALLSAVPVPSPKEERNRERIVLCGDVPSAARVPSGCRFRTRCPQVFEPCADHDPALLPLAEGHRAACLLHQG
jgi:peptide/nickel transport system ATP-binding protein